MSILHYVLMNLRLVMWSASGFIMMFLLIYKTAGLRYPLLPSATAFFILWILRFFVLSLYISNYLGDLYHEERWYFFLFQAANAINVIVGVLAIAVLFKGRPAKNLLIVAMVEVALSLILFIPLVILTGLLGNAYSTSVMDYFNPLDFYIPVLTAFLIFLVLRFGEPFLQRYREWNPKHPVLLNIMITAYLVVGIFSNYNMTITRGNVGLSITMVMMLIVLSYFWYDYLHMLRMQESARREELISLEKSMKKHYADVLEQTAKLNYYNQEISTAINRIINKILATEQPVKFPENEGENNFLSMASRYLEEVRQQYDELTVRKYCEDVQMNELLLSWEEKLKNIGMEVIILFREYRTPADIAFTDIASVINWILEGTIGEPPPEEQMDNSRIILHGGMAGKELILSCEADGKTLKKPDPKDIRKLIRRVNAELDIIKENDHIQVLTGIPSKD